MEKKHFLLETEEEKQSSTSFMVSHAYLSPQACTASGMVWYRTQRLNG